MAKTISKVYQKRLAEQAIRDAEIQAARDAKTPEQRAAEQLVADQRAHEILLSHFTASDFDTREEKRGER